MTAQNCTVRRVPIISRRGQAVALGDHLRSRLQPGAEDVGGGDLGLPPEDMERHIAYDVGAAGVARALAEALDAPVILSDFSRLVIDPNRGEDDPTLLMKVYDGSIIPANRHADAAEVERRLARYHRPYHRAIEASDRVARAPRWSSPIHSFTPQFAGRAPRPWHVGVLYAGDTRLALPLLARLNAETTSAWATTSPIRGICRAMRWTGTGCRRACPHVLIEVRNDLIETPGAARLGPAPCADA
jgi:predicted N-formylglutamate amidohydrolase